MTATIDERVVQMAFQNSDFEKNVGTSLSTLDKLKKALNFGDAGRSFNDLERSARGVNLGHIADGVSAISNRFSALGVVGIGVLLNLANTAVEAGKRILNALVIDPIKAGLNEYETKLNSIQTILANTQKEGTNLEQVTAALNQLNEYSDKTIYNFQQMARNVGTFTAAGVKLDTSVAAIKGIANLAALSGSNAEQASTAMYQLSQALSTGTVRLMDWNSVAAAGMGGQVFQDAIVETARVHGVAIDQILEQEGGFRNSLQTGWLSSEILTESLQKFTGDLTDSQLLSMGYTEEQIAGIQKMAKTASDAATKVKTFSQLMGTLAEAAQSGWAQTWEIIIGDFDEAKAFFTDLNNFFGGLIGQSAKARNELLQGWSDLGGRTKIIEAFQNAINAVVTAINPIRDAMREIFPPITAKNLMDLTEAVAAFTKRLILTPAAVEVVKRVFKGVFAILDIGKMAVLAIAKEFGRLLGAISPVGGSLTELLAKLGDFLVRLRDGIKLNDTFGKVMRAIGNIILVVAGVIGKGIDGIIKAVEKFKLLNASKGFLKAFVGAISEFFSFFKDLDFSVLDGFIERIKARFAPLGLLGGIFGKSVEGVEKATNPFREKLNKIAENVREALSKFALTILDKLSKIDFSKFSFKGMFDSINAGLLGALLLAITRFVNKGSGIFGSIVDVFKGITGIAENASGILASISTLMNGVKDILTAYQQQIRAGILQKIAIAIAVLAGSLLVLSLIDSEKLTVALGAVTALFADLIGALAIYEKVSGTAGIPAMAKAIGAMFGLSVSILLLSSALAKVSKIPTGDIVKGVLAIAALTAVLVTTSKLLAGNELNMVRGVGSMILFSIALRALIGPVKKLGAMKLDEMAKGLVGLGVMLAEIGLFIRTMNFKPEDLDDVIGLLVLSGAIATLSSVIEQLGALDSSTLTQGLTVLGVLLTGLAAFTKAATGGGLFLATSAGILVLAGAMEIIADVLKKIGSMSIEEVTVSLAGLGGSLLILGVALNAMTGGLAGAAALLVAAAALAILAPSLKLLGSMSIESVGIALLALAGTFTVLGVAGAVLTPVVPVLLLLAVAVAALGVAVLAAGVGVGALAAGLALLATVGVAGGGAVAAALLAVAAVLPLLAAGAALALIAFARVIKEGAPVIFEAGKVLLSGLIKSVTETMPMIVELVLKGLDDFLRSVAEKTPSIVQSGYDILLGFLSGVRDNIGQVVTVSADVITAYLNGISEKLPQIVDSGWRLIIAWINGMKDAVAAHMPELITSIQQLGIEIVKGLVKGLLDSNEVARQGIMDVGQIIIDAFKERLGIQSPSTVFMAFALQILQGLVDGLKNNVNMVIAEILSLGQRMIDNFKKNVSLMYNMGRDLVRGFANGIRDFVGEAIQQAQDLAGAVIDTVAGVLDSHSPSRKLYELGKFADQGLAGGILGFANLVTNATKTVGEKTVAGFGGVISKISSSLNTEMDFQPTIRPVMDLSEVQTGSSRIESLLSGKKVALSLTASNLARSVSTPQTAVGTTEQTSKPTATPTISYTQINNSPKELSRIEIYRQTRNQLLQRGVVGGTA